MTLRLIAVFIMLSSLVSLSAIAQQQKAGPAVSTGRFEAFMSAGYMGISSSSSQIDLAPGFQVVPLPKLGWLQVGGDVTYQRISIRGGSSTNFMIMAGPTFNLGGATLNESFFVTLGAAIRTGAGDSEDATMADPNGFGFYFLAGKRFPIGGGWCIRPSVGVVATGTTGMVFRPFAASFHF